MTWHARCIECKASWTSYSHNQRRGRALTIGIEITADDMMTGAKETLAIPTPTDTAIMTPKRLDRMLRREKSRKMTTVQEISPRMTSTDVTKTITDSLRGALTLKNTPVAASGPHASLLCTCLLAEGRPPSNPRG